MRAASLASLLVVSLLVAGCAEPEGPAATEGPEVILVTDQNDVQSLGNESFMMAAHQHDYWGDAQRLVVLDDSLARGDCCLVLGGGVLDLEFVPFDGSVVPHGTARVEVTVTWTDGSGAHYSAPELLVRTAEDHGVFPVGPLAAGETVVIETTDEQLDLPHQALSAWRFVVRLHPGAAGFLTQWDGDLRIVVEAVRGREIPIYPPHPDLWDGRDAITLFEDRAPPALWTGTIDESGRGYGCLLGCWPQLHRPIDGTVVPFDAALVEVTLDARPDPGFEMGLKFHGADARAFTDLEPTSVEGTTRTYLIPVELGMGDSPYATQSVWGFAIYSAAPERDGWFSGSYSMSARVLRVV